MSSPVPHKTAIITGACSGIGLALTRHLLSSQTICWRVVLADINQGAYQQISSTLDPTRTMYHKTDVSSWEDNRQVFKKAFEWPCRESVDAERKIDFFAANACIRESDLGLGALNLESEPAKPNLNVIDVGLSSVIYGLKLFVYYARKTRTSESALNGFRPAMVITSSASGLYGFPPAPQYCAVKHGLVGLTRSVGPPLLDSDDMTVNAILPGFVLTELTRAMSEHVPPKYTTSISTILGAFDSLMDQDVHEGEDVKAKRKTGQCVEISTDQLYYRKPVEYCDEAMRWIIDDDTNDGFWMKIAQRSVSET